MRKEPGSKKRNQFRKIRVLVDLGPFTNFTVKIISTVITAANLRPSERVRGNEILHRRSVDLRTFENFTVKISSTQMYFRKIADHRKG